MGIGAFCPHSAQCGTCEHIHAAFIASKRISCHKSTHPARSDSSRGSSSHPAGAALAPGVAARIAPVVPSSSASGSGPSAGIEGGQPSRHLLRLLKECGLLHMATQFHAEGVTAADLATASPDWLKAWFPEIKAGPAKRLLYLVVNSVEQATASQQGQTPSAVTASIQAHGSGVVVPHHALTSTSAMSAQPCQQLSDNKDLAPGTAATAHDAPVYEQCAEGLEGVDEQQCEPPPCAMPGWLVNYNTGVAHPTDDGTTPSFVFLIIMYGSANC